jgi:Uma2 family endonuclease
MHPLQLARRRSLRGGSILARFVFTFASDDGIVVVMRARKITVGEYLELPETLRPMELVWGVVREPPSPRYGHQAVLARLGSKLYTFVQEKGLGDVCFAPMDVVLDEANALVLQPDVLFVTNERRGIIRDRIWGAPDLVVEVLSPRTAARDRVTKVAWYRRYGVRECWLADRKRRTIEVLDLQTVTVPRMFAGSTKMRSDLVPGWEPAVEELFG